MLPIVPIKFGGSLITFKAADRGVRIARLDRIAQAIAACSPAMQARLVIILGGGSIGHRAAVRYGLSAGAVLADQVYRMSKAMFQLKYVMAQALERQGVAAFPIHEGSIAQSDGAEIRFHGDLVLAAITGGMIPILSGGPIMAEPGKMIALNSDRIGSALHSTGLFRLERYVLLSDVPGVLDADRQVIAKLGSRNRQDVADLGFAEEVVDISGGMIAKVDIALDLASRGVEAIICGKQALALANFEGILAGRIKLGTHISADRQNMAGS